MVENRKIYIPLHTFFSFMQENAPRSDILNLLKRNDSSVGKLSSQLGISSTATRQHLSILERDGLVQRKAVKEKIGRPKIFFSLTEKSEKLFPKAYSALLTWMIKDMIEQEGAEAVGTMMGRLGTLQASYYKDRVGTDGDINSVVKVLNELGTYAELKRGDGHVLIEEYNCLINELALEFGDIVCEFDLKFIGSLLNSPVALKSCIARGDRYCSFVVHGTPVFEHAEEE
jgi:predicted ArsR family transcriptional regulator